MIEQCVIIGNGGLAIDVRLDALPIPELGLETRTSASPSVQLPIKLEHIVTMNRVHIDVMPSYGVRCERQLVTKSSDCLIDHT